MSQPLNNHAACAFLDMEWGDVPDVSITAPQSAQAWRATLSAVVSPQALLKVSPSEKRGVVSTAHRGVMALVRIELDPQEIAVTPAVDSPLDLRVAVVLSGTLTYTSHSHRRRFSRGDIFTISPLWDAYHIHTEGRAGIAVIQVPVWWLFDGRFRLNNMAWMGAQRLAVSADFFLSPVLLAAAHALLRHDGVPEHLDQAQSLLGAALIHTFNAAAPSSEVSMGPSTRFTRIYNHIMTNITSEDLSPRFTAKALRISLRTLHQACADNGMTFGAAVADMRMSYAAYLLRNGSAQISEVAYSVGFRSLSHFCRLFKIKHGVSARRYRLTKPA